MKVESILKSKGRTVETIAPDASIPLVVHRLTTLGIGALVVSRDGQRLEGIVSERDIVRGLARHGSRLMELRAADIMSKQVRACEPDDTITHVMAEMTRSRNRHLPVLEEGRLCGVVSIGDVVKNRLEELEMEATVLRDAYRAGR
ncbi:MAG: CBS domain-containing protein [Acidimicrobiales bacterium]